MYRLDRRLDGDYLLTDESGHHVAIFHAAVDSGAEPGPVAKLVLELLNRPREHYLVHVDGQADCTKYATLDELTAALSALIPRHPTSAQAFIFIGERCEMSKGLPKSLITPDGVAHTLYDHKLEPEPNGYLWSSVDH